MTSNNNIPQGYKQTELGIIPEDWEVVTIQHIADITTGNKNTQDAEESGKYPFYVRSQNVERINSYCFDCDGVVTAGDGVGTGKIFHFVRGKFALHQRAYLIYNFKGLDPLYFYSYFSQNFYERINQMTAKSSVDSVRKEMIENMQILKPPLAEQKAIATALSDVDALIVALDKKIEKKKLIKQGAMQQLLAGKKRLPGFTEEWEEIKLGDFTTMNSGGTPSSSVAEYYNGDIPFLSISDITTAGKYIYKTEKCITDKGLQNSSARMYPIGTIMYAMYASLGKTSISNIELSCSQAILGIQPNHKLDSHYLYYHLSFIENEVKDMGQTGTQSNLSKQIVQNFILYIPTNIKEQQAIATILSDMDKEISDLEAKRDKYRLIKRGMMQKLLTGQIRLRY